MAEQTFDLNTGAIAPLPRESTIELPPVTGEIPAELDGLLVRNGPNPFDGRFAGNDMLSWWVAPAMVHGLRLADGKALDYRNRWVKTDQWAQQTNQPLPSGRKPNPSSSENPNVSVIVHDGRILALGEGGTPHALSSSLETIDPFTYHDVLPGGMTAHPKLCPTTGELVFFRADWQEPFLSYGVLGPNGDLTHSRTIEVPGPAMMHDFAITASKSIVLDLNVAYDFSLLEHGVPIPLRWHDDRPSRLGVLDRHGSGPVSWFDVDPCFIQHVTNAYEQDATTVVLDVVRYDSFLRFDPETGGFSPNPLGEPWRYTLDLAAGSVIERRLHDVRAELPRINELRTGLPHRFAYLVEQPTDTEMRGLLKYDSVADVMTRHPIPTGDQNSEPVFASRHQPGSEDDGWLLACVYRAATHTSDVVILDATDLSREPVATIHLPIHIPAGFHGTWIATTA